MTLFVYFKNKYIFLLNFYTLIFEFLFKFLSLCFMVSWFFDFNKIKNFDFS